jgi:hypothetical protein
MCDLCSDNPTTVSLEKIRLRNLAKLLRQHAQDFDDFADGEKPPHGKEANACAARSRALIRELVNEWL